MIINWPFGIFWQSGSSPTQYSSSPCRYKRCGSTPSHYNDQRNYISMCLIGSTHRTWGRHRDRTSRTSSVTSHSGTNSNVITFNGFNNVVNTIVDGVLVSSRTSYGHGETPTPSRHTRRSRRQRSRDDPHCKHIIHSSRLYIILTNSPTYSAPWILSGLKPAVLIVVAAILHRGTQGRRWGVTGSLE